MKWKLVLVYIYFCFQVLNENTRFFTLEMSMSNVSVYIGILCRLWGCSTPPGLPQTSNHPADHLSHWEG